LKTVIRSQLKSKFQETRIGKIPESHPESQILVIEIDQGIHYIKIGGPDQFQIRDDGNIPGNDPYFTHRIIVSEFEIQMSLPVIHDRMQTGIKGQCIDPYFHFVKNFRR
jgi:hypothetical protein